MKCKPAPMMTSETISREDWLDTIRHSLRTPLTGILGLSEFLASHLREEDHQKLSLQIKEATNEYLHLLDRLLDYRILTKTQEFSPQVFNLKNVIEQVITLYRPITTMKPLVIQFHWDEAITSSMLGEAAMIQQVVQELFDNAVQFTDSGQIKISVHLLHETTISYRLALNISDTGRGIAVEDHGLLTEKFFRAEPSYTNPHPGLGLGLAIVKEVIQHYAGILNWQSIPGRGSTFECVLTLNKAIVTQAGTPKMLLLSANPISAKVLQLRFGRAGWQVTNVSSMAKACLACANSPFELIVIDDECDQVLGLHFARMARAKKIIGINEQTKIVGLYQDTDRSNIPPLELRSLFSHLYSHPCDPAQISAENLS